MLRLLYQISRRQLQASWGRAVLIAGGVATGVTLIVAISIINNSVLYNFRRTIDLVAGPAALEVTMGVGEIGFDESAAAVIRADPDVVAAVPLVRGTVALAADPSDVLYLYGADFTAEHDLERYPLVSATDRRAILAGFGDPRSVLLSSDFAARHGLGRGSAFGLITPEGVKELVVHGLLDPHGVAAALDGRVAVMDLPAAQLLLGKSARVDQIDVVVRDGSDVGAVQSRLAAVLPAGLSVGRPEQRGERYEHVLRSFQAMLSGWSTLCLVAGIFIVYNTTSTGAVNRSVSMATMRHIGADPRQLFRLLMIEAAALGLIGTGIGLGAGVFLAKALTKMVTDSMGVIFQLRFPVANLDARASHLFVIACLGVGAALFASFFAARRVAAVDPLRVLREGSASVAVRLRCRPLVAWWALLVGLSVVALRIQVHYRSIAWGNFGSTLWFASSIIIAVPIVMKGSSVMVRVLPRFFGTAGRVAAESLSRSPARAGVTVAAIALVITVAIFVASMGLSFRRSINGYFTAGFLASDLTVSAVTTEGGWLETPISREVADRIAEIPGVRSVDTLRVLSGQPYRGERIAVAGLSDGLFDPSRYPKGWYHEGDAERAAVALRSGTGAKISISLSERFDLHVGDSLDLDTPKGRISLDVVGVVPDYMSDRGGVGLSARLLETYWEETTLNRANVELESDASVDDVRRRIAEQLGPSYRLKILTLQELATYHDDMVRRAFAFTDAIQLLVVFVTIAGILDLLLSAIYERRRELGLLRIVGADEGFVRRSVMLESATIGLLGAVLGVAVGAVTAWIWVGVNLRYLLGYYLEYHLAFGAAARYVALTLLTTIVAGYVAAYRATRMAILDAIHAE